MVSAAEQLVGAAPPPLLAPHELNVVPEPDADEWLVLAVCGYADSGAEAGLLEQLRVQDPELRIAGISSALVHGMTVLFLLAHQPRPAVDDTQPAAVDRDHESGAAVVEAAPLRFARARVPLQTRVSALDLVGDRALLARGSLLQLHVVCADRPGLVAELLEQLGQELEQRLGLPLSEIRPSVWYARTDLADGRVAVSRLMVRLAVPLPDELRTQSEQLDDVERALRRALRTAPPESAMPLPLPSTHTGWWDAPAVVSLRFVHAPAPDDPETDVGPETRTETETGTGTSAIDLTEIDVSTLNPLEN